MKFKLFLILPLILITAIFLFLFPKYYFNQQESQARQIFSSIEEAKTKVESTQTTEDLDEINSLLNKYQLIIDKRGKVVFLLSSKYKEYYTLSNQAFAFYKTALEKFTEIEEYERGTYDILTKKDQFRQGMIDVAKNKSINWDDTSKLINSYADTRDGIDEYYNNGLITEGFYNALVADINANVELFNLFYELSQNNYVSPDIEKKITDLNIGRLTDATIAQFQDTYDKITKVKLKESSDLYNQSIELRNQALSFYGDNNLSNDPFSTFLSKFFKKDILNVNSNKLKILPGDIKADLDGDGEQEVIRISVDNTVEESPRLKTIFALDKNGNEIGRLPEGFPIKVPSSNTGIAYTPLKEDGRQFFSYDFYIGPHSSQTMFFGLFELATGGMGILPVCPTVNVESAVDCLFWSGEVGSLVVNDLDKDGVIEVIEIVDEYPKDDSIGDDIEKIINKEIAYLGQDKVDGMIRIAKREQGGRGNSVIWGIYSYNGEIFEEQLGEDYERYYVLVNEYLRNSYSDYPTIMRKSDMSKSSLEYNEFMKDFWTGE